MGKGRAPCCDKSKVKRGPWSPAEDLRLITFIHNHGHGNWRALPRLAGLLRCGKSCRLRWINYLRPDVKRGNFSPEEEQLIIDLHSSMGNKWSKIASHLPGRTDNEIKNVWNTHLKKRVARSRNDDEVEMRCSSKQSYSASPSSPSSGASCISYGYGDRINLDKGSGNSRDDVQDPNVNDNSQLQMPTMGINTKDTDIPSASESAEMVEIWEILDCDQDNNSTDFIPPIIESNIAASQEQVQVQPPPLPHNQYLDEMPTQPLTRSSTSSLGKHHQFHPADQEDEEEEEESGYKKWLRYLENELGLVGGTCASHEYEHADDHSALLQGKEHHQNATENDEDDLAYFPIWPSSPLNFDF